MPDGPLTLLQIGIGIIDLSFCALAMYMLVPDEPNIGFVTLAVIFVSATLLGFASHAPGGIGVFDAAMLVALWQYDKEELLAGLLLFRLLYYLIPFALSLAILGAREVMLGLGRPPPRTGCLREGPIYECKCYRRNLLSLISSVLVLTLPACDRGGGRPPAGRRYASDSRNRAVRLRSGRRKRRTPRWRGRRSASGRSLQ